ncbi:MAG: hypothetical protein HY926_07940 [Elusimicrobia bacterium]|nr:hypothetical protein [Elusimicrobiota bacterium]
MNRKDLPATKEDISGVKTDITGMKGDITGIKGDIAGLKIDVTEMKGDIAGLKIDVTEMKGDIGGLKTDIARLDAKIDSTSKTLALEIIRTQTGLQEVRETMSTKSQIDQLMRSFDEFTAQAVHYNRADAIRGQTLIKVETMADDHERRILALESARPRPQAP